MDAYERWQSTWDRHQSLLCVGLDPDLTKLPEILQGESRPLAKFCRAIIDATAPYACAFKPQFAYFAGQNRLAELAEVTSYLREHYPDHALILDVKRGDIGATAAFYAREAFTVYGATDVTVNPYMGGDTIGPFIEDPERGVFVLCRTSNPGATDLQDLMLEGEPLFLRVARKATNEWNANRNVGLVVGATWPEEIGRVRAIAPETPLLVPGIGAQGGDLSAVLAQGLDATGAGLAINASRSILYASGGSDFAEAAAREAKAMGEAINERRASRTP